jgi:hypothetical protein
MMTKKIPISITLFAVLLACSAVMTHAQQPYPKVEVFGGYSLEYLGLPSDQLDALKTALVDLGATVFPPRSG